MVKKRSKKGCKQPAAKETLTPVCNEANGDKTVAAALTPKVHTPMLVKVCRLCETKDGPFLNIFDAETTTAKKIDEVMPFTIEETDNLPQKICFRCSAKLEELYEFLQKCIKTQENLHTTMGKTTPKITKPKHRALWEEKLIEANRTNEDICNALIRRAVENIENNIKDIPLSLPTPPEEVKPSPPKRNKISHIIKDSTPASSEDEQDNINLKQVKLTIDKSEENKIPRATRANKTPVLLESVPTRKTRTSEANAKKSETESPKDNEDSKKEKPKNVITNLSMDYDDAPPKPTPPQVDKPAAETKTFNIMDHVSIIKVNGVGILFQCKLCNRNFLKKEVVESHGCAKNNVPKDISQYNVPVPGPPKPPTVKYITMDKDFKKNLVSESNKKVEKPGESKATVAPPAPAPVPVKLEPVDPPPKPKPKAGPASKKRQMVQNEPPAVTTVEAPIENKPPPVTAAPTVNFPTAPSLHSRYKLVPGPNNTFTLVEDAAQKQLPSPSEPEKIVPEPEPKKRRVVRHDKDDSSPEVINLEDDDTDNNIQPAKNQPYPVGLFQAVPHGSNLYPVPQNPNFTPVHSVPPNSNVFPPTASQYVRPHFAQLSYKHAQPQVPINQTQYLPIPTPQPNIVPQPPAPPPVQQTKPTFTTPAMKKQSYTVVQTGNPSKLLISSKPQPKPNELFHKKSKTEIANEKNRQNFAFVNIESGTQPPFILPTEHNNIIQESQITTSTVDRKIDSPYMCNMCNEKFSREKKLLAHIASHYSTMDEEDQKRSGPGPKRRSRKT